jgi:hypothetical protein
MTRRIIKTMKVVISKVPINEKSEKGISTDRGKNLCRAMVISGSY